MTIIEIEDTDGNTLCHFRVKGTKKEDIVTDLNKCSLADVESDYLTNTNEPLLRIQLNSNNIPDENDEREFMNITIRKPKINGREDSFFYEKEIAFSIKPNGTILSLIATGEIGVNLDGDYIDNRNKQGKLDKLKKELIG